MNGYRAPSESRIIELRAKFASIDKTLALKGGDLPDELDWRKVPGRVSRVKNQGLCGSCWAFSAVGALEGQEKVHGSGLNFTELSEQNLVDCVVVPNRDMGCNGGYMSDSFEWVKKAGGINDENSYPYEAVTGKCRFKRDRVVMTDAGAAMLPAGDEQKLKEVVAKYGPVSVAINTSILFVGYYKGVLYDPHCKNDIDDLDHAVLVVGYGTDPINNEDYWIIKNSWGEKWGESGYIRMVRNKGNMCGIASMASIPTF